MKDVLSLWMGTTDSELLPELYLDVKQRKIQTINMKAKSKFPDDYVQKYRENIGRIIRNRREGKGYSQGELAEMMEVQRSTISKIENGKFAVSIDYIVKFAWYLDFDIEFLPKEKGL